MNLHELTQDLGRAQVRLAELQQAEAFARNAATDQLNEVNRLQKAFDDAAVEIRNKSGQGTDWAARRRSGQNMAAE